MNSRTLIVDYGRGNIFGLSRALERLGVPHAVSSLPDDLEEAPRIILPGVGAFADTMEELRRRDLVRPLIASARQGTPLLGICVGFQVMFEVGEEFGVQHGLGLLRGRVVRLPEAAERSGWRVPNVGWRPLQVVKPNRIVSMQSPDDMVYFVHSYSATAMDPHTVVATMAFGNSDIVAAVEHEQLFGVQFHPERSGRVGLDMLRRFCRDVSTGGPS